MNQATTADRIFQWRLRAAFNQLVISLGDKQIPSTLQYSSGFPLQAYDFVKFALAEEIKAALNTALEILEADSAGSAETLLTEIGQGRTGHGQKTEVKNYRAWLKRMRARREPKAHLCSRDIEAVFESVWQGLGWTDDILKLSRRDAESNYQVALAVVIFEITMRHRMALILPLGMVSTTWKDQWLAILLARWNGVLPDQPVLEEQLV